MPGRWRCADVNYFVTLSVLDQLGSDLFFTRLDVNSCDYGFYSPPLDTI